MRLEVKNLEKSFKSEKVLQDINLDFTDGHIYGIIGRNGSGKSVLFKIICGFMHADGGTVSLDGKSLEKILIFRKIWGRLLKIPDFCGISRAFPIWIIWRKSERKLIKRRSKKQCGLSG